MILICALCEGIVDEWKVGSAVEHLCLGSIHWDIGHDVPWQQLTAAESVFCTWWLRAHSCQ